MIDKIVCHGNACSYLFGHFEMVHESVESTAKLYLANNCLD